MKVQNNISALNRNRQANKTNQPTGSKVSFADELDNAINKDQTTKVSETNDEFDAIIEQANIARLGFENSANVTNENIAGTTNSVTDDKMAEKIMALKKANIK